jgi:hypothetical protein
MKLGARFLATIALLLIGAVSGCSHCPPGTSTRLEGPAIVLQNLAAAYTNRDSSAYRALLTEDFVYQAGWLTWGLKEEMSSASGLFSDPYAKKVRLRFPCGCRVEPGESCDTWILDDVRADLRVDRTPEPLISHEDGHRFFVRRDSAAAPGYRISRWESPGPAIAGDPPEARLGAEIPAPAIDREVARLAASNTAEFPLWPGFDPLAIPLAVYDGERTYLFRHPSRPQGFTPLPGAAPGTSVWPGRYEAVTANTNTEIGGVPTATLMVDQPHPARPLSDLAAVAIHEGFHVYQRAHHPGWIGNEADLFVYPTDSADLLAVRRLETEALRLALVAGDTAGAACWARRALALRAQRYALMDSASAAYERGTELNEGLATYVEMRATGRHTPDFPPAEFGPTEVRRRAYIIGASLALLLDQFKPGWPAAFEANDHQTLDGALAAALAAGSACTFPDDTVAAAQQKARTDVAALAGERERRLAAFEAKPGWRIIVEAGAREPLWPQGFDPLNVERVGAGRVLHTRYLRLGNGAGRLEVLNAEALTDGAGPHPLFQGVRRVELTGLPEPKVSEAGGKVLVDVPGLTLEFAGASFTRNGKEITVRVGS